MPELLYALTHSHHLQPARARTRQNLGMKQHALIIGMSLLMATLVGPAHAQTTVTDAWVRGVVAQQKATGLFAKISSVKGGRLVAVSSPAAAMVEIHEMRMVGDVMQMRELSDGLALPAGKVIELKPGGYHVMLMGLKRPLKTGDTVALTLVVEGPDKKRENVEVKAVVRGLGDSGVVPKH